MAILQPIVETGMARGGPNGALEAFLGFAAGDPLRSLSAATIERMKGNAEVLFGVEFGTFECWRPDEEALARVAIPVAVMCGRHSAPFFAEASHWIAGRLNTTVIPAPWTHRAQLRSA
jgi:pimeloyl-ACP methyl ester carboxylesterase